MVARVQVQTISNDCRWRLKTDPRTQGAPGGQNWTGIDTGSPRCKERLTFGAGYREGYCETGTKRRSSHRARA